MLFSFILKSVQCLQLLLKVIRNTYYPTID